MDGREVCRALTARSTTPVIVVTARGDEFDRVLLLDTVMDAERAITIYARINLVQGPNTETMLRQLGHPAEGRGARRRVEFDLAYADLANRPIERAWLDLIFESPRLNAVTINDVLVSHHPRAQA